MNSKKENTKEKQVNYGMGPAQAVDEIALEFDRLRLMVRDEGLPPITRAQLALPFFRTAAKMAKIWISPRGLSLLESLSEARKEVLKDKLKKGDIDSYLLKFMSGVSEVIKRHADEVAEVMINGV